MNILHLFLFIASVVWLMFLLVAIAICSYTGASLVQIKWWAAVLNFAALLYLALNYR